MAKNPPANAGDLGSIPRSGRFPGEGCQYQVLPATHSSILAWRIPWTEEPGRLQSTGLQKVRHPKSAWELLGDLQDKRTNRSDS